MSRPRYHVATVGGDIAPRQGGTSHPVGLSAHVIDRLNAHKVCATFRSEERLNGIDERGRIVRSPSRGQDGARAAAEALAAEWNAEEDRQNRRAPAKVPPGETSTRDRRGRV